MTNNTKSLVLFGLALLLCACSTPVPGPANSNTAPAPSPTSSATPSGAGALPASAYKVEWVSNQIPLEMQAGQDQTISVTFKNTGDATWPSKATGAGYLNQVSASYHWLLAKGSDPLVWDGIRTPLPHDIVPGETITLNNVRVSTPRDAGSYRLVVTLVQDGVGWFDVKGATPLTVSVSVR